MVVCVERWEERPLNRHKNIIAQSWLPRVPKYVDHGSLPILNSLWHHSGPLLPLDQTQNHWTLKQTDTRLNAHAALSCPSRPPLRRASSGTGIEGQPGRSLRGFANAQSEGHETRTLKYLSNISPLDNPTLSFQTYVASLLCDQSVNMAETTEVGKS